ncbi:MAG: isocitrate/isopropylmalate family dehydrogenase, partial [Flavobacteriales bacterium]|nr:isocitrate/isopropylmalate family dehydrogenase [Flavobacteriales bacterium]
MNLKIGVLPGDGIGPEIIAQAVKVLDAVAKKYNHNISYTYAQVGGCAIDKCGNPYPESTHKVCMEADAVLFGAIGDPKFDNDPSAKVRPEQGLLAMRKKLGLYANIRPVSPFSELIHRSPL